MVAETVAAAANSGVMARFLSGNMSDIAFLSMASPTKLVTKNQSQKVVEWGNGPCYFVSNLFFLTFHQLFPASIIVFKMF